MHIPQGTAQNIENVKVAVVLAAIVIAVFWRLVLRLVLAALAAVVLVALGYGVLAFIQAAHTG